MAIILEIGGIVANPSIQKYLVVDENDRDTLIGKVGAGTLVHTPGYAQIWEMNEDLVSWTDLL